MKVNAYYLYYLLNAHVADTDLQVEVHARERFRNITMDQVQLILDEHHAAQQLVKEMRF